MDSARPMDGVAAMNEARPMGNAPVWERSPWHALASLQWRALHAAAADFDALARATAELGRQWAADPAGYLRWPGVPARWFGNVVARRVPDWRTPNEVVFGTPFARLRDFSGADAGEDVVPTLVLPPQAGHSSAIVDYAPGQSQLGTIRAAGLTRAFSFDWLPATSNTSVVGIDDYLAVIERAVEHLGGPVNLIGDCQGGWLAAIYAALHPADVHTLTLAGAPIDFHAGDGAIAACTQLVTGMFGLAPYRALVAAGGGNMPGHAALAGFIAIRPEVELARQVQLLTHLDDAAHVARYQVFEDWFKHTQDIPGAFYLWLVEHLFLGNELIRGELRVGGRPVDLGAIDCPLYLLAGASDHITPAPQLFAAATACGTAESDITLRTVPGGHLGLFMGRDVLTGHWAPVLADIHARSTRARSTGAPSTWAHSARARPAGVGPTGARPAGGH